MFSRSIIAGVTATLLSLPAFAAEMVQKVSPHSVDQTVDRLERAVENAGANVFARVDHAENAASVDMQLRSTQLLIFGNPKVGTPAMQDAQTVGLDLPMRVLVFADGSGVVQIVYHDPMTLTETHGLPQDAEYLDKMAMALDNLTDKAIAQSD